MASEDRRFYVFNFPDLFQYTLAFDDEPPDDVVCQKCSTVSPELYLLSCGHRFCSNCYKPPSDNKNPNDTGANKSLSHCPIGGHDIEPGINEAKRIDVEWDDICELRVICPNIENGCKAKEKLKDMSKHIIKTCTFRLVPCTYCFQEMTWGVSWTHMTICPKRPYECPDCKESLEYEDREEHEAICPEKLVVCEFCGRDGILRKKLPSHEEMCHKKPRPCKMQILGCDYMDLRPRLSDHESMEDHVDFFIQFAKDTKETLEALDEECANLRKQLALLTGQNPINDSNSANKVSSKRSSPNLSDDLATLSCSGLRSAIKRRHQASVSIDQNTPIQRNSSTLPRQLLPTLEGQIESQCPQSPSTNVLQNKSNGAEGSVRYSQRSKRSRTSVRGQKHDPSTAVTDMNQTSQQDSGASTSFPRPSEEFCIDSNEDVLQPKSSKKKVLFPVVDIDN